MTNGQNSQLNIGKNNLFQVDLSKLKSGIKAEEFKDNAAMLEIFNASDTNKNSVIDQNELSIFTDKLVNAAGEDNVLTESETKKLIKQEQHAQEELQKSQGKEVSKTKVKAQDVFDFAQKIQDWSKTTKIKSSVVEGDKRIVSYENGAQEVINKDGSKVITTISGGVKTVQTKNSDGTVVKEEITDEENGFVETLIYDDKGTQVSYTKQKENSLEEVYFDEDSKRVKSHTLTSGDTKYEIGTEGFANGKVTRQVIGEGDEQQVLEYKYNGENDFTKTLKYKDTETVTTVKNGEIATIDATQYDKQHQKVQSVTVAEDGTKTVSLYKNNKVVYDAVTSPKGRLTETQYNESGHKLSQQITSPNGKIQIAEYDGHGNTKVVVQNGENIQSMGRKFNRTTSQLVSANKGHVYKNENGSSYFLVGDEVKVPGEFPANHKGLQNRNGAAVEIAEYTAQEEQRVAARLQGKEQKTVTVQKDYSNWYKFAEEQLKSEGISNPSKGQINDRTNELLILNPNVEIPKKGKKIVAIKTEADLKAEKMHAEKRQASEVKRGVVNGMVADYNKALTSFNHQMDKDGWAADVADAVSYIWNNDLWSATGNTARQVRQDLNEYKNDLEQLRTAYHQGDTQFKTKFKEIFGVEYNQQNVESYNGKKNKLAQVSTAVATEKAVTTKMDKLFAQNDEKAIKSEMKSLLGLSDSDMDKLAKKLKSEGKSLDINYMKSLYSDIKKGLAANTKKALGGKTLQQYENEMNAAYKKAYGNRNDIVQRVSNYNASQDTGAAVVKTTTKIVGSAVIAAATGGTASGLLLAAVGSSALSFTVDATDMMSDNLTHSASEYGTAAKNAAIDGAGQVISGGMSKYLKAADVSRVARYTAQAATDVGVDLTAEYLETGEVHLSTAITSALASVGGEALGDFLEARAARKALDLGEIDEAALAREYGSVDQGWLGNPNAPRMSEGERISQLNPAHSRYMTELTSEQIGAKVKRTDVGSGFALESGDTRGVRYDVTMNEHQASVADINNLLGKKGASTDFGKGLVQLEDRFRADRVAASGAGIHTNNAKEYGTFASNEKVKSMGLQDRLDIVQDAAQMSGLAYSDAEIKSNGWKQITSASADNGFHAKAFEKDGVVMIAFRGSDDVADLKVDHQILSGHLPDQFDNACEFLEKIKAQYPNAKIVVTGHSLGGGLTELVSSKYDDVLGLSFDAVGTKSLVQSHGLKDNHNTINYVVKGDIISNASEHVGSVTLVNEVVDVTKGNKVNSPHAIGNFMGTADNSLSGVEAGILQLNLDGATASRAKAEAKGLTLSSAIASSTDGKVSFDDASFKKIQKQFAIDVQGMNVDLNAMQAQINAVSNPQQKSQLQNILDIRKASITEGANIKARSTVLQNMTGDEINDILARDFGFTEPGFLGGDTPSQLIQMDKDTKFVRVFNDESSFAKGSWLMPYDEVVGKSAAEIKDFYALPAMPKYIVEVEMPAGAKMYTGKCNPLEGWGNGGGTQFFLIGDTRPKLYGKMVALPQ